jgi:hypothetical protein
LISGMTGYGRRKRDQAMIRPSSRLGLMRIDHDVATQRSHDDEGEPR